QQPPHGADVFAFFAHVTLERVGGDGLKEIEGRSAGFTFVFVRGHSASSLLEWTSHSATARLATASHLLRQASPLNNSGRPPESRQKSIRRRIRALHPGPTRWPPWPDAARDQKSYNLSRIRLR